MGKITEFFWIITIGAVLISAVRYWLIDKEILKSHTSRDHLKWIVKAYLGSLGIGTAVGAAIFGNYEFESRAHKALMEKIFIEHLPEGCKDDDKQVGFKISNNTKRILKKVQFYLEARKEGRSTDLLDMMTSLNRFESDKIMKPGETVFLCWKSEVYSFPPIAQEFQAGRGIEFTTRKEESGLEFMD